jgi:hypothetical protein
MGYNVITRKKVMYSSIVGFAGTYGVKSWTINTNSSTHRKLLVTGIGRDV